jgi:hypothetical protein
MKQYLIFFAVLILSVASCDYSKQTKKNVENEEVTVSVDEENKAPEERNENSIVRFFIYQNSIYSFELFTKQKNIKSDNVVYGDVSVQVSENGELQTSTDVFMKSTSVPYFANEDYFSTVFYDKEQHSLTILVFFKKEKCIQSFLSGVHFIRAMAIIGDSLFFTTENYDSNVRKIDLISGEIQELGYGGECSSGLLYFFQNCLYVTYGDVTNQYLCLSGIESSSPQIIEIPKSAQLNRTIEKDFRLDN